MSQLLGKRAILFDWVITAFVVPALTWMFGVGVAGCIVVMPWCALKMFAVLFEKDDGSFD